MCDLSLRGSAQCASLSLAAIKWVSYKIKTVFLSLTLSKQKISSTLLKITFIRQKKKRSSLLLHQIVQRGSITDRIHLLSHFYRHAALWLPMMHESVMLNMEIHSVIILFTLIPYFNLYFKATSGFKKP